MSEPRPPLVWVLQEPRTPVDLGDARGYGPLRLILPAHDLPSIRPGGSLRALDRALRDYRPGDYILQAPSDPVVPLLTGLVLQARGMTTEPIQWLRYDKARKGIDAGGRSGFYTPVTIDAALLSGPRREDDGE